jgi:hypothetical protein
MYKFTAFTGYLLTPNACIKIGSQGQSQLPVKTIYLCIQVFRKLILLYVTFSFAFLKSACVTFICCSQRVNRPTSGVCADGLPVSTWKLVLGQKLFQIDIIWQGHLGCVNESSACDRTTDMKKLNSLLNPTFNFHIHLRRSYVCRIYLHSFHLINLFHMQFVTCPD